MGCLLIFILLWSVPAQAQAPRIGVLLPLSGKHKRLGEAVLDAVTLAQTAIDDLEFVIGDTRGTAEGARRELARLASDPSVVAVLGPIGWEESRAAAEEAQRRGVPLISLSAQEGVEHIGGFVFRGRPSIEMQARVMAEAAVGEMGIERFAILHPDDALGRGAAKAFFEAARRGGGRVTAMVSYKTGETNLQKAVEELVAKRTHKLASKDLRRPPKGQVRRLGQKTRVDFEAIFIPDYDDTVSLATRFLDFHDVPLSGLSQGVPVQILGTAHMHGPRLAYTDGLISGALYPELFDLTRAGEHIAAFNEAFRDAYDREPVDLDAQVVDLFAILAEQARGLKGIAQTETARRRQRIVSGLIGMKAFDGLTGKQWFEEDGAPGHEFQIWVVNGSGDVAPSF